MGAPLKSHEKSFASSPPLLLHVSFSSFFVKAEQATFPPSARPRRPNPSIHLHPPPLSPSAHSAMMMPPPCAHPDCCRSGAQRDRHQEVLPGPLRHRRPQRQDGRPGRRVRPRQGRLPLHLLLQGQRLQRGRPRDGGGLPRGRPGGGSGGRHAGGGGPRLLAAAVAWNLRQGLECAVGGTGLKERIKARGGAWRSHQTTCPPSFLSTTRKSPTQPNFFKTSHLPSTPPTPHLFTSPPS